MNCRTFSPNPRTRGKSHHTTLYSFVLLITSSLLKRSSFKNNVSYAVCRRGDFVDSLESKLTKTREVCSRSRTGDRLRGTQTEPPNSKPRYQAPSFCLCQLWLRHGRETTQAPAHLSTETAPFLLFAVNLDPSFSSTGDRDSFSEFCVQHCFKWSANRWLEISCVFFLSHPRLESFDEAPLLSVNRYSETM